MFLYTFVLATLFATGMVVATPVVPETICKGTQTVTSTQFIGVNKDVKLEYITCDSIVKPNGIEARQTPNVCGAACTTNCFPAAGGGPDPNECHIIADALRFDSQNIAPVFTVGTGSNNIMSLSFASCTTFFLNQATTSLNYCRNDFASVIDFVAPNCQATQNAHGGNCVANDGRWFIQVQHS